LERLVDEKIKLETKKWSILVRFIVFKMKHLCKNIIKTSTKIA
jgi:hypothetical protein